MAAVRQLVLHMRAVGFDGPSRTRHKYCRRCVAGEHISELCEQRSRGGGGMK